MSWWWYVNEPGRRGKPFIIAVGAIVGRHSTTARTVARLAPFDMPAASPLARPSRARLPSTAFIICYLKHSCTNSKINTLCVHQATLALNHVS